MLDLATILLPVDFSERSIAAARYAGALACRFQSKVILLHVVPNEYPIGAFEAPIDFHSLWNERLDDAQRKLDAFLADDFRRMPVKRFVLDGDPATRIVQVAGCEGVKLIVMPTHGYGPFRRFILGSVTAKVLHDADCAVLTSAHIKEGAPPEALAFRNILCAVDLGAQSRSALAWAGEFAAKYQSRLHVMHALPSLEAGQAHYFDSEIRATLHRSAEHDVEALLESAGQSADVLIEYGAVARAVRSAAESVKADCVVIGRHASSGLLGRLHADAYAIVRESPCPVISV
jgi:nucleotide-binding universal stress UspA family protein